MTEYDIDEKLNQVVCLVRFIVILDNKGRLIYGKYFNEKETEKQREIEKKLCFTTKNLNINPGEVDIFNMDEYNVFVKLIDEVAYFIAINEDDNECLGYNFCRIFENNLGTLINETFTRKKILETYDKISIMVDEMVFNGIIVNTDNDNLFKLTMQQDEVGSKFINFAETTSSSSGGLFGSLLSGARSIFG